MTTVRDETLLNVTLPTGLSSVEQMMKCLKDGTNEAKSMIQGECDVLYECNLPNFLAHKRIYCKTLASATGLVPIDEADSRKPSKTEKPDDEGDRSKRKRDASNDSSSPSSSSSSRNSSKSGATEQTSSAATTPSPSSKTAAVVEGQVDGGDAATDDGSKSLATEAGDAAGGHRRETLLKTSTTARKSSRKPTINFFNRLVKRIEQTTIQLDPKDPKSILHLHTLPAISKIVPNTVFENGVQKIVLGSSNLSSLGFAKKESSEANSEEDSVLMVFPEEPGVRGSSCLHSMTLRNLSGVVFTREVTADERAVYARLSEQSPVPLDLKELRCLESDCCQKFPSPHQLAFHLAYDHVKQAKQAGAETLLCFVCGAVFQNEIPFMAHLRKAHAAVFEAYKVEREAQLRENATYEQARRELNASDIDEQEAASGRDATAASSEDDLMPLLSPQLRSPPKRKEAGGVSDYRASPRPKRSRLSADQAVALAAGEEAIFGFSTRRSVRNLLSGSLSAENSDKDGDADISPLQPMQIPVDPPAVEVAKLELPLPSSLETKPQLSPSLGEAASVFASQKLAESNNSSVSAAVRSSLIGFANPIASSERMPTVASSFARPRDSAGTSLIGQNRELEQRPKFANLNLCDNVVTTFQNAAIVHNRAKDDQFLQERNKPLSSATRAAISIANKLKSACSGPSTPPVPSLLSTAALAPVIQSVNPNSFGQSIVPQGPTGNALLKSLVDMTKQQQAKRLLQGSAANGHVIPPQPSLKSQTALKNPFRSNDLTAGESEETAKLNSEPTEEEKLTILVAEPLGLLEPANAGQTNNDVLFERTIQDHQLPSANDAVTCKSDVKKPIAIRPKTSSNRRFVRSNHARSLEAVTTDVVADSRPKKASALRSQLLKTTAAHKAASNLGFKTRPALARGSFKAILAARRAALPHVDTQTSSRSPEDADADLPLSHLIDRSAKSSPNVKKEEESNDVSETFAKITAPPSDSTSPTETSLVSVKREMVDETEESATPTPEEHRGALRSRRAVNYNRYNNSDYVVDLPSVKRVMLQRNKQNVAQSGDDESTLDRPLLFYPSRFSFLQNRFQPESVATVQHAQATSNSRRTSAVSSSSVTMQAPSATMRNSVSSPTIAAGNGSTSSGARKIYLPPLCAAARRSGSSNSISTTASSSASHAAAASTSPGVTSPSKKLVPVSDMRNLLKDLEQEREKMPPEVDKIVRSYMNLTLLTCRKCGEKTANFTKLRKHCIQHLDLVRFKCKLCNYGSLYRSHCMLHVKACAAAAAKSSNGATTVVSGDYGQFVEYLGYAEAMTKPIFSKPKKRKTFSRVRNRKTKPTASAKAGDDEQEDVDSSVGSSERSTGEKSQQSSTMEEGECEIESEFNASGSPFAGFTSDDLGDASFTSDKTHDVTKEDGCNKPSKGSAEKPNLKQSVKKETPAKVASQAGSVKRPNVTTRAHIQGVETPST